jgi:hypothetical protein
MTSRQLSRCPLQDSSGDGRQRKHGYQISVAIAVHATREMPVIAPRSHLARRTIWRVVKFR